MSKLINSSQNFKIFFSLLTLVLSGLNLSKLIKQDIFQVAYFCVTGWLLQIGHYPVEKLHFSLFQYFKGDCWKLAVCLGPVDDWKQRLKVLELWAFIRDILFIKFVNDVFGWRGPSVILEYQNCLMVALGFIRSICEFFYSLFLEVEASQQRGQVARQIGMGFEGIFCDQWFHYWQQFGIFVKLDFLEQWKRWGEELSIKDIVEGRSIGGSEFAQKSNGLVMEETLFWVDEMFDKQSNHIFG